ncbi:hypothetical protein FOZ63_008318, partial [Perkinsus olseni]
PTPVPGVSNLDVLEINPHTYLAEELHQWGQLAHQAGYNDLIDNVEKLQDWISGIPGIDEATALSSVVDLLEGGHYDIIVFDTAPTGHTLKLLQLPDILQVGLTKLESWQASLWQYWQMVKGGNYSQTEALRKKVTSRIRDYKKGIEKVGRMLKDRMRTTFVVVCIAEYLSIKESQRLLRELHKDHVAVSHVVVNQLVLGDFTTLPIDDATIARKGEEALGEAQWSTVTQAVQFCRARNSIQQRYLSELCNFPEVADANLSVVQLPLLPYEVTGVPNLLNFSQMLLPDGYRKGSTPKPLVDRVSVPQELYGDSRSFMDGDRVVVTGLVKAQHYNGKPAEVVKVTDDGRVAVRVEVEPSKFKMLSLKQDNLKLADDDEQDEDEEELHRRRMHLPLHVTTLQLSASVLGGNSLCWSGGFTEEICCRPLGSGNPQCWDGAFTYDRCCKPTYTHMDIMTDADDNMPNIMTYLSTMDGACLAEDQCKGDDWEALMRSQTLSMTMNVRKMPIDVWAKYVQIRGDRAKAVRECAAGVVVVELLALGNITDRAEALSTYERAVALGNRLEDTKDCYWMSRVNHAYFRDYHLFLFDPPSAEADRRCAGNLIYVYETPDHTSVLYGNSIRCASIGTGFTEVYLHRQLLRSPCRTRAAEQARWFYVPVYFSCLDLHLADPDEVHAALMDIMTYWDTLAERHLIPLLSEIWKLSAWHRYRKARFVVVEALPVQCSDGASCRHCPVGRCFKPGWDVVLPSATSRVQAERLGVFARLADDREYLVVGHFEHANTSNGHALAQSYRSVNETTRLDLIRTLQGVDDRVSVGGPNLRYGFLHGNSHFCLAPRGRGWWTMRVFEAIAYSRCIPVILSDDVRLPFTQWIDWSSIAVKWPMDKADVRLYEYLSNLSEAFVRNMHRAVDVHACWFDWHHVDWYGCGPYAGLLRTLQLTA